MRTARGHWQVSGGAPLLSVVILTLDSQEFIEECLRSIPAADRRLETLVVDGGSRDSTMSIVRERFPRVLIHSDPGSTIPRARNAGLRASTGAYVLFLDSDERLRAEGLETLLECLETEAPPFVVTHNTRIDREGRPIGARATGYPDPYGGLLQNPVSTLAMVCRRELLLSVGGFSEAYPVAEDYELWLRVFEVARGRRLEVYLGEHRVRGDSATQSDILRTRLFGARAALAAAKRRRMPLHFRALLLGYWSLFLVDALPASMRFGDRSGQGEGRIGRLLRSQLRNLG